MCSRDQLGPITAMIAAQKVEDRLPGRPSSPTRKHSHFASSHRRPAPKNAPRHPTANSAGPFRNPDAYKFMDGPAEPRTTTRTSAWKARPRSNPHASSPQQRRALLRSFTCQQTSMGTADHAFSRLQRSTKAKPSSYLLPGNRRFSRSGPRSRSPSFRRLVHRRRRQLFWR